jgi:hypothetical protein
MGVTKECVVSGSFLDTCFSLINIYLKRSSAFFEKKTKKNDIANVVGMQNITYTMKS